MVVLTKFLFLFSSAIFLAKLNFTSNQIHDNILKMYFLDTECANLFEALVGTLRAAKKRGLITFQVNQPIRELFSNSLHWNYPIGDLYSSHVLTNQKSNFE